MIVSMSELIRMGVRGLLAFSMTIITGAVVLIQVIQHQPIHLPSWWVAVLASIVAWYFGSKTNRPG